MSERLITTIIPTYRRPSMLRRAIRSVLNQTYKEFRVCVYDNASGDETVDVVEEFRKKDSRVEYFLREKNIGAHRNFVESANQVETNFFSFLPDDDVILPHFFKVALEGFDRYPEAALSLLATLHVTPRGFVRDAWVMEWPEDGLLRPPAGLLCCLRWGNPGLHAILIRREIWTEFGGFDEATEPGGDFDFELRVGAEYPIVVSRQPGAIQVVHGGSQTAGADLHWVWPPMPRIIKKVAGMNLPPAAKDEALARLAWLLKRGLVVRGGLRSMADGKWTDAERAAELLEQLCAEPGRARLIRGANALCRSLPGARLVLRVLFQLRNWQKAARNSGLRWQFREYSELLRI